MGVAPPAPDGPAAWVGRVLDGRFRIVDVLDSGGIAVVYRAEHGDLGRQVAVKVLQETWDRNDELRARFGREARALAALTHPHIVSFVDYGMADGHPYLVMELLEGRSLKEALETEGPFEPSRAFDVVRQVLRGLGFAHERGLLHRDLKSANVFLQRLPDTPDHVKLLDFGFAKFIADEARDGAPLTRAGSAFGTPAYMAPEQLRGPGADGRADLYAVAVILYELLGGRRPFEGETRDILRAKLAEDAPALGAACPALHVRPELEALLARVLARDPERRPRGAADMMDALASIPQPAVTPGAPMLAATPPPPALPPRGAAGRPPHTGIARPLWNHALTFAARLRDTTESLGARVRIPRLWFLPLFAVPLVLGVLLCGGVATWWALRASEPSAGAPVQVTAPRADGEEPLSVRVEGLSVPDPFDVPNLPAVLEATHARLESGEPADGDALRRLRRYATEHRDDPRPHLLSGHVFMSRGWRTDALEQYEHAYRIDRAARGDPRMAASLVALVTHPTVGARAERAVKQIYGSEALPVIDAALESPHLKPAGARRLARLRRDLAK